MKQYSIKDAFKALNILNESEEFTVTNSTEMSNLNDFMNNDNESNIEQVIDINAETEEELKTSYVGNIIIKCPACNTNFYKEPDEVKFVEDEDEDSEDNDKHVDDLQYCNEGEECHICGNSSGYIVIGKVAPLDEGDTEEDVEVEKELEVDEETKDIEDETDIEDDESDNDVEDVKDLVDDILDNEKDEEDNKETNESFNLTVNEFDEKSFDSLVQKYLNENYENVESYKTINGDVDTFRNKLIIEGIINFKNGKNRKTKFIFEAKYLNKKNVVKFCGINESFTKAKRPYTLSAKINEDTLVCNRLVYNYKVNNLNESIKVAGAVNNKIID